METIQLSSFRKKKKSETAKWESRASEDGVLEEQRQQEREDNTGLRGKMGGS